MNGGIFLLRGDDDLVEMTEAPYDTEDVLQALLARYPSLLAGDQLGGGEPRRWLLISREAGLPAEEDGTGRWSVDHLFLDQDAVPTLVEVKRSSDTRIRREVVGQMLDYASNAVVYWPGERLRDLFERRCGADDLDSQAELGVVLGPGANTESFWEQAAANLKAGRIRLVFVSDEIPSELRRVVEFLNGQMTPADVLAIEVKQYVGEGLKTLVPRVIGQTAESEGKRARREGRQWDEESFFAELEAKRGLAEARVARDLLTWTKERMPRFAWGKGAVDGSFIPVLDHNGLPYYPLAIYTYGRLEVQFQYLSSPPFDNLELRRDLQQRLNEIPGVTIPDDAVTRRPSIPLSLLAGDPEALRKLLEALDWFCDTVLAFRLDQGRSDFLEHG